MEGVLLIGLGNYYSKLAYNMAKSIKRFSDIKICCITDEPDDNVLSAFDIIIEPKLYHYLEDGIFNPFKLKTHIYDYTPFEHTIYLDVDGIALNKIDHLFKNDFYIQEVGRYSYEEASKCDMVWVNKVGKSIKDIFIAYNLSDKIKYPEYNSSIIIFRKNKNNKKFFEKVQFNYNDRRLPFKDLGGLYPDELAFNLASCQLGYYNDTLEKYIYFQWENKMMPINSIKSNYTFLGMAGGYHGSRLRYFYENDVKQYSKYWKFESRKKIFHNA